MCLDDDKYNATIIFFRKTAAQIRRLRESIQAKAFKMNNRPAFYEKRKGMKIVAAQKITEEERLDQENQVSKYQILQYVIN